VIPPPNRARAADLMAQAGVEAFVAVSPSNVRYLTGYWCWLAPLFREFMVAPGGGPALVQRNLGALAAEGHSILVVEPLWAANAIPTTASDVRVAGDAPLLRGHAGQLGEEAAAVLARLEPGGFPADPVAALAEALTDHGLDGARLGVERDALSAAELEALGRLLPRAELLDCSNALRLLRAVKTEDEIACLERAAEITERAGTAAMRAASPGSTQEEVLLAYRAGLGEGGADFDHFAFALDGLGLHTGGRPLQSGDASYVDWGCLLDGWFSDTGTTLVVGDAPEAALRCHDLVRDAVAAGEALLRPGTRGSEIQRAMQERLAAGGIRESFPHGHGLGLDVRDYPVLVPAPGRVIRDDCVDVPADLPLEAGMVVNLEAPVFAVGGWSAHCERSFVVTAAGSRPLTSQDRQAPLVAAGG
jgi:Xaa-Pro dipeptidase